LAFPNDSFDIALIQSVLHHDDDPRGIIREAFRVAPEVLIHEPNGNNLGLKVFERLLPYHRAHHEKSYTSRQLKRWIEECDGQITFQRFAGFVPMFCPDRIARAMKAVEPLVERIPFANTMACAVCVYGARRAA
jgi:SAM-dependent methyltransferase